MRLSWLILRLILLTVYILHKEEVIALKDFIKRFWKWEGRVDTVGYFIIYTLVLDLLRFLVVRIYRRRKRLPKYKTDNFILGVENIATVLLALGFGMVLLKMFNMSFRDFFLSIGIVAAALTIMFKEFITNFFNGMVITFSNQLSIDDYIQIGETQGRIIDITLANIRILNEDDDLVYIPNNMIQLKEIINYSKGDIRKTVIDFEMDYRFLRSVTDLEERIIRSMDSYTHLVRQDSHLLRVWDIQKDKVVLKFQFTLEHYDKQAERMLRRHVERFIIDYVREIGERRYF